MKKISISGNKYGRLTVLHEIESMNKHSKYMCLCECGKEKLILMDSLRSGRSKSCGCLHNELLSKMMTTHKMSKTRTYTIWHKMKIRCDDPSQKCYKNYGGRGIKYCDRWSKFENFFADLGECPNGLTIERIDNNKGYFKENVKWATRKEQCNNTRANRVISHNGMTMNIKQWSEYSGIEYHKLKHRTKNGMNMDNALKNEDMRNRIKIPKDPTTGRFLKQNQKPIT